MIRSHSLVFSDFSTDWYKHWAKELKQTKNNLEGHSLKANKFWQNAVMAQVLHEKGLLNPGKSGIGFGVGQERLPALFASKSIKITATDQDFRAEKAKHWEKYELAQDAHSLNSLLICEPVKFSERVSFQAVDMNKIPNKLYGEYDFVWSNCALGHLGSIEAGLDFIVNSARCLKPGGYAVHTTEINVLSDNRTVTSGNTVIFRPKDIYRLSKKLFKAGFELEPLRLTFGSLKDDLRVTMHPIYGNDYSKIHFQGHLITQVVLIIRRPTNKSRLGSGSYHQKHFYAYLRNVVRQKVFTSKTLFLDNIKALKKSALTENAIQRVETRLEVSLKQKPKYVFVEFENTTHQKIYGVKNRIENAWPVILATAGPPDRNSNFQADDWFNSQANRPSSHLFEKSKKGDWAAISYIKPTSRFAFRVKLDPKAVKKGMYQEKVAIVQEGCQHLPKTEVTINIKVA